MTAFFATLLILGGVCCLAAIVWSNQTRHVRAVWRASRNTDTVAIVLELEACVRELELIESHEHALDLELARAEQRELIDLR